MQRCSKVLGWIVIRSLHRIRWYDVRTLASICNTMIGKFSIMPYLICFEFQVLGFICNTYCIVLFVLRFEAPLSRCLWLMLCMQHWPIAGYLCDDMPMIKRLHQCGIGGLMGSYPPLVVIQIAHNLYQFWLRCCLVLKIQGNNLFLRQPLFTIVTCSPF